MHQLEIWIEGIAAPFTLRFNGEARAVATFTRIGALCEAVWRGEPPETPLGGEGPPWRDDFNHVVGFRASNLRAMRLAPLGGS